MRTGYITFNPSIPGDWKEYYIRYKYGESIYNIKFLNVTGKNSGVEKVLFNGKELENKKVRLQGNNGINEIEVEI